MAPDRALTHVILDDITYGRKKRAMVETLKAFWIRGLQYATADPDKITWQAMFPICARLIQKYLKASPEKQRSQGAFVMVPEFLDIASEYLWMTYLCRHKDVSLHDYWKLPIHDRLKIQVEKDREFSDFILDTRKMKYVRDHAAQRVAAATGVRACQMSYNSADKKKPIDHDDLGKNIDYHIRTYCYNPRQTAASDGKCDIAFDLLDQKSWSHNVSWVTCTYDT